MKARLRRVALKVWSVLGLPEPRDTFEAGLAIIKLEVKEGDVLAVTYPRPLTDHQLQTIRETWVTIRQNEPALKDVPLLVCDNGAMPHVLRLVAPEGGDADA